MLCQPLLDVSHSVRIEKICRSCNFQLWGTGWIRTRWCIIGGIYKPEPSSENGGFALNNAKPGVLVSCFEF